MWISLKKAATEVRLRWPVAALALPLLVACAACSPYLDHQDAVVSWAGDAQNANIAIMAVDPRHPRADQVRFSTDGARLARRIAVDRTRRADVASVRTAEDLVQSAEAFTDQTLDGALVP
ncbi:hypothetical protein [Amorphus coralli]|uniref:hypothetical protein n=1 Tax=Amorphus coralli TaxID=340680 RepID=UPI000373C971|nr:hypothetical protein [Amorphus coralli]